MVITRFHKSAVYLSAAFILNIFGALLTAPLHKELTYESAYYKAVLFLFVCGCVFLAAALYSRRYLSKKDREHRRDTLFFFVFGLILLVGDMVLFFIYGGIAMDPNYISANIAILSLALLPMPFLLRGIILAFSNDHKRRTITQIAACALAVLWVALIAAGLLLKTNNASLGIAADSVGSYGADYTPPPDDV